MKDYAYCRNRLCGRPLKSAKSRRLGYGPSCYKKLFEKNLPHMKEDVSFVVTGRKDLVQLELGWD